MAPSCAENSLSNPQPAIHSFLCCTSVTHLPGRVTHALHSPLQTGLSFSTQVFLSGNSSAVVNSSLISPLLPFHPSFRDSQSYSSAAVLWSPCHSALLPLRSGLPPNPSPAAPLLTPAFISSQRVCISPGSHVLCACYSTSSQAATRVPKENVTKQLL